jgi:uncharacterized membrane protein
MWYSVYLVIGALMVLIGNVYYIVLDDKKYK